MRRSMLLALPLLALAIAGDSYHSSGPSRRISPGRSNVVPPTPKGHKKFIIQGQEVWALNLKNAEKKYIKSKNKKS